MVCEQDAVEALSELAHEGKTSALAWAWVSCAVGVVFGVLMVGLALFGWWAGVVFTVICFVAFMALGLPYGVNAQFFGTVFDD